MLVKCKLIKTTEGMEAEVSDLISEGGQRVHSSFVYHNAGGNGLVQLNYLMENFPNAALLVGRFFTGSSQANVLVYQQLRPLSRHDLRMELMSDMLSGLPGLPARPEDAAVYRKTEGILDLQSRTLLL